MRAIKQGTTRILSLGLTFFTALCLAQAAPHSAMAQQAVSISPSVVLVLKLVSSTLVKPTTGIVVSDDGLVLVPADFAAEEGEVIVLDGGTDIISNGRPAKVLAQAVPGDWAVLSVAGLKRPGFTLSKGVLTSTGALHLEAFPPAEYIAKGAQPLWVPVTVLQGNVDSQASISSETPLPYVSGAIVDNCGYLAGVILTTGPQNLDTDKAAQILLGDQLSRIFAVMQITLPTAGCEVPVKTAGTPAVTAVQKDRITDTPKMQAKTKELEETKAVELETPRLPVDETTADSYQGNVFDPGQQANTITPAEPPSVWSSVPLWLPLFGVIILGAMLWKGLLFFRLGKDKGGQSSVTSPAIHVQPASDEPVTAPLATSADHSILKPRSAPLIDFDIPELGTRPEGCDGVLVVEGLLDADTAFKRFCFVNTEQVNIIIGRGNADIAIEHAAISRSHVRVESAGGLLTLSDLGSRNGSFIGDVPCLPGEIMYFQADDEIFLGEVKLKIRMLRQEAEWA